MTSDESTTTTEATDQHSPSHTRRGQFGHRHHEFGFGSNSGPWGAGCVCGYGRRPRGLPMSHASAGPEPADLNPDSDPDAIERVFR
jgi:hypothetical protein